MRAVLYAVWLEVVLDWLAVCVCVFQLAPDDAWRCPHCKQLQQGRIKLSLWTLPDVLILHLKRFRQVFHLIGTLIFVIIIIMCHLVHVKCNIFRDLLGGLGF